MDVRNASRIEPIVEHNGTTPVWYFVEPGRLREATGGGSLELVNQFEVPLDGAVFEHTHPTHEWYYVLKGRGTMIVEGETRGIDVGDLVYIPPEARHCLRADAGEAMRCFCFAVALPGVGSIDYTSHKSSAI